MQVDSDASVTETHHFLKGKSGHRGWALLPKEILHSIVTAFINDVSAAPLPLALHNAPQNTRVMYSCVRAANYLLPLMAACRQWGIALTDHAIWSKICYTLDHHGEILSWLQKNGGRSSSYNGHDYEHYRILRMYLCIPCRLMAPNNHAGYGAIRHRCNTTDNGVIGLCLYHEPDRVCGNCLRAEDQRSEYSDFLISRNEDPLVFPGLEATCVDCRRDALYQRAYHDSVLHKALREIASDRTRVDWEIRQTFESFIEFGSVSISSFINTVWERNWLRKCTKLIEYLDQAVASVRYENREEGYGTEDEISEDEDVMCIQEDAGVRDIAIGEYCRARILDGNWTSPFDAYTSFMNRWLVPITPAKHPLSYLQKPEESHPTPDNWNANPPPTQYLAERLSVAFTNEMRKILGPALNNLVRKISIESMRERIDPSVGASRITLDGILEGLRDEGVWFENYDWAVRWDKEAKQAKAGRNPRDEDESNSSSDGSLHSHQTSPVLSTTTLQTTPSPPPVEGETIEKKPKASENSIPLKSPSILRYIPLVPESLDSMSRHSKDTIRLLWREAASVLYHCRCSICVRAMQAEKANAAAAVLAIAEYAASTFSDSVLTSDDFDDADDIELQDAIALERRLNSHIIVPEYEESQQRTSDLESDSVDHATRKRSSEEIEDDGDNFEEEDNDLGSRGRDVYVPTERVWFSRKESPVSMKRIKLSEDPMQMATPTRKRSSEEMETCDEGETGATLQGTVAAGVNKKARSEE